MRTSLLVLTAGAAAAAALGYLRAKRARSEKKELKEEIRKWEDEGGHAAQVPTPSPVEAPEKSVPDELEPRRRAT
jgi:hypothetical protein